MGSDVRYALACRDATNQAPVIKKILLTVGLGWLRHDKLKHIGHQGTITSSECGEISNRIGRCPITSPST